MSADSKDTAYLVITEDRHSDVDIEIHLSRDKAVERAKAIAEFYCDFSGCLREEPLVDAAIKDGWIICIKYSCEGDCVRVLKREIK